MQTNIERNPIFKPLWTAKERYICMKGSAGSGKSVDTAQFYILRILSEKGRNLLCVRKIDLSNRHSTFAELQKAISKMNLGEFFSVTSSPMRITCKLNGNEILFGGVNDEKQREKLKSITATNGQLTDIWVEEATELEQSDLEILDDRLRGVLPPKLFYQIRLTFNPVSSSHWIKKVFFDRSDKNVLCHQSTYRDNKFCDKQYYERMERRKQVDPEGYRVYGLGEWGETSGLIFSNYKVCEFDTDISSFDDYRIGQDFGYNHANAILSIGIKDDDIYICSEIYVRERTTEDIIRLAQGIPKSVPMICDSAEPDRIVSWQRAGYKARAVYKFDGSVSYAIDWLKRRKIFIHPSCVNTISEISEWRWLRDSNGNYTDSPVPFKDDAMAALRYGCSEWIPKRTISPPKERTNGDYSFSFERKPEKRIIGGGKILIV